MMCNPFNGHAQACGCLSCRLFWASPYRLWATEDDDAQPRSVAGRHAGDRLLPVRGGIVADRPAPTAPGR